MHGGDVATVVYTDGACRGNPGRGGWGWIVPGGQYAAGAHPDTTNNRMEMQAVLEALNTLGSDRPVLICTDSTYITKCFSQKWWQGWQRRDWRTSAGKPVANRDLWEPLIRRVVGGDVAFRWVKGHSGDRWNDAADSLATSAADSGSPTSGDFSDLDRADATPRSLEANSFDLWS